jgi:hypothetical protein
MNIAIQKHDNNGYFLYMYIVFVFNRFLGTTPDSSTIGPLLKSLILQIKKIYGQETSLNDVVSLQLPYLTSNILSKSLPAEPHIITAD